MWTDSECRDVGVGVPAADAPLRCALIPTVGVVEVAQGFPNAGSGAVLAAAQPKRVAQRGGEVELDRLVVAVAA